MKAQSDRMELENPTERTSVRAVPRWRPFDAGLSVGTTGSEGGTIVVDEEHEVGARITLEHGGTTAPFSITCGIYGWLMHIRFFDDRRVCQREFFQMKLAVAEILALFPDQSDSERDRKMWEVIAALEDFIERFPSI